MFKKSLYIGLIILGILGIIDSIWIMRISVGTTIGTVLPGIIGIVLIVFAVLKLKLQGPIIPHQGLRRTVIALICIGTAFFLLVESFILFNAYSKQAERTEVDYVIVLGCGIFPDGSLTLTLMKRLNAAIDYLEDHPDAQCIVSGGQGGNEPTTEAYAMKNYLVEQGIDADRIIEEGSSTSTRENLLYSYDIIQQHNGGNKVAIATSDFHIFRTKMLARRYGMEPVGLPSNTTWYIWINCYLREFFAVVKSFILD